MIVIENTTCTIQNSNRSSLIVGYLPLVKTRNRGRPLRLSEYLKVSLKPLLSEYWAKDSTIARLRVVSSAKVTISVVVFFFFFLGYESN